MRSSAALLLVVSLALYAPAMNRFFVSDDFVNLERNRFQTVGEALGFFATEGVDFYRPLPRLHFGLFQGLFGDRVLAWNLAAVLLHGIVAAACVALGASLLGPAHRRAARWAGLFFAVHFIHVEPVVWASGITSVYVTLFVLLAILFFRRARETESPRARTLSVLAFAAALLSKETAVAFLPLLAVTQLVWPARPGGSREESRWPSAVEALPYAIVLAAYLLVATRVERGGDASPYQLRAGFHVLKNAAFFVLGGFLPLRYWEAQELWSASLARGGFPEFLLELLRRPVLSVPIVAAAGACAAALARGGRDVRGGFAWILAAALPFLALPGTGERFLYLPSFGACLVLGLAVEAVGRRLRGRWRARGVCALLVALHVAGNLDRQRDWITASRWTHGITGRWSYFRVRDSGEAIEFAGIPDAHRSAWVFRNGFDSMVRLYMEGRSYWREGEGPAGAKADERMAVLLHPGGTVGMMPAHLLPEP
jgi:hypothetical protein